MAGCTDRDGGLDAGARGRPRGLARLVIIKRELERRARAASRRSNASSPGMMDLFDLFFDFGAVRTEDRVVWRGWS